MSNLFQIGSTYSFEVYATAILGSEYKNVKVLGILTAALAAKLKPAIYEQHVSVYPYIPAGTPNKATGYDYIQIETQGGITDIIGVTWINASTIQISQNGSIDVKVRAVTSADVTRIRNILLQMGYNDNTVEFNQT